MNNLRPWLIGLLLGLLVVPVVAVHAQSSERQAVVLLASSNLQDPGRAALAGLLTSLNNELSSEDRIGVILYSDIVEHVSKLAPPSAAEPARIERVLDSLPAVDPLNTAVGVDRALELLSKTRLPRSIIIIGELDVRLENAVLMGRYSRWLEGTLLPTAASEGIGLMVIAEQASHQGLLQRYGSDTFAHLAAIESSTQELNALALQHVRTRAVVPTIEVATLPADATDDSSVLNTTTVELAPSSTELAENQREGIDEIVLSSSAVTTELRPDASADTVAAVNTESVSPEPLPNAPSSLFDRLSSLAMAPLFMLAALVLGLVGAGLYYQFGRGKRHSQGRRHSTETTHDEAEPPLTLPASSGIPAYELATELANDATVQKTRSNQDDGESRFDALIDSLGSAEQETLPVSTRQQQEIDDATIDTRTVDARTVDSRTVDTRSNRSQSTADMTRELEDLTRERGKQYDFE